MLTLLPALLALPCSALLSAVIPRKLHFPGSLLLASCQVQLMDATGWRLVGEKRGEVTIFCPSDLCGLCQWLFVSSTIPVQAWEAPWAAPSPHPNSHRVLQILGWYRHLFPLYLILGWGRFLPPATSGLFPYLLFCLFQHLCNCFCVLYSLY